MAIGDSGSRLIGNTEFYGGISTDPKIGIENSYADAECLDVRKSPGQMSVLPSSRQFPGSTSVTGLVVAMEQSKDGNIWAIDENGKLYKIDENNNISVISNTAASSGFSLAYFQITDGIWYADAHHTIFNYGKILNASGQAVNTHSFNQIQDESEYVVSQIVIQTKDDNTYYQTNGVARSSATNTTSVGTSISETNANKALLLGGISPIAAIKVRFSAKPNSGTVKLIVHDEGNNIVAQSLDVSYNNVSTSGYTQFNIRPNPNSGTSASNQFSFTPWAGDTIESGSLLHIHIVASTGGFVVRSIDSGSMYTGLNMQVISLPLLETFNKKHPMAVFDKVYIGNGQYVASLANSPLNVLTDNLYSPHQLRLDDGFEVCALSTTDEYLIIGAEKNSVSSTRGFQAGRIYFWDFQSEGPVFYIDCKQGAPQAIYNHENIVYVIISGALYAYTGGKELIKVRTLKGTDTEYSGNSSITEVYPNMMAIRREIMLAGFPSDTTATSIRYGVHGWGTVDKNFPNSWTYNYKVPGTTNYNSQNKHLRIGCVYNFNDTLFYSYEVSTKNGNVTTTTENLAVVDNESGAAPDFYWHSLVFDAGSPALVKDVLRVGIYFEPLPSGCTITPVYRLDGGDWQTGSVSASASDTYIQCDINKRFHELQFGFVGTTQNGSVSPVIKQVAAEIRILNEEAKLSYGK